MALKPLVDIANRKLEDSVSLLPKVKDEALPPVIRAGYWKSAIGAWRTAVCYLEFLREEVEEQNPGPAEIEAGQQVKS